MTVTCLQHTCNISAKQLGEAALLGNMLCLSVCVRALPLHMLTDADGCWRILTYVVSQYGRACSSSAYADGCWWMLAYTDVCCVSVWACVLFLCICWRMLTDAGVYWRILCLSVGVRSLPLRAVRGAAAVSDAVAQARLPSARRPLAPPAVSSGSVKALLRLYWAIRRPLAPSAISKSYVKAILRRYQGAIKRW
jgi:hypothetical protein